MFFLPHSRSHFVKNHQDSQALARKIVARALAKGWTTDQTLDELVIEQVDLKVVGERFIDSPTPPTVKLVEQLRDCVARKRAA
jgi:hypothetical protein